MIEVNIRAQNPSELIAYLAVLGTRSMLVPPAPAAPLSEVEDVTAAMVDDNYPDFLVEATETEEPAPKPPAKRGRGRPRKVEAAPEPAEAAPEPAEAAPAEDEAEDPFEVPAVDTARDPAVDHGLALELLRAVYDRPGAAAEVNDVLKQHGVAKFSAIPKAKGTELLDAARALDRKFPA